MLGCDGGEEGGEEEEREEEHDDHPGNLQAQFRRGGGGEGGHAEGIFNVGAFGRDSVGLVERWEAEERCEESEERNEVSLSGCPR